MGELGLFCCLEELKTWSDIPTLSPAETEDDLDPEEFASPLPSSTTDAPHPASPRAPSSGIGLGTMDGFCHKDGEGDDMNLFDLSSEK
jgi:hypothetical protein